jgi:hypothetical protein
MGRFCYRDPGTMATIGRRLAVAQIGRWRLSGTIAWLAWLFVHVMALVRFENRLLVLAQWGWHYLTWNRNARLITSVSNPSDAAVVHDACLDVHAPLAAPVAAEVVRKTMISPDPS